MKNLVSVSFRVLFILLFLSGCARNFGSAIPVDTGSATPGGTVTLHGAMIRLTGTPLQVGQVIPATSLIDDSSMKKIDLSHLKGRVLILSLVPSLDTKVCESQTHLLGEMSSRLPSDISRITISRDTPFAQKRFAEEAKLSGITYLSDYKDGSFGRSTGLLQEDSMLLARSVIIVDKEGIVRYLQVVPELSHLPDMDLLLRRVNSIYSGK